MSGPVDELGALPDIVVSMRGILHRILRESQGAQSFRQGADQVTVRQRLTNSFDDELGPWCHCFDRNKTLLREVQRSLKEELSELGFGTSAMSE